MLTNKEGYQDPPYRTATETVMKTLETFGEAEPKGVVIIHTDVNGEVIITANTNKCNALGMIETAKHMILTNEA